MRKVAVIDEQARAEQFGDALYARQIVNQVEQSRDGSWAVWVREDSLCDEARSLFEDFQANPDDEKFQEQARAGRSRRAKENRSEKKRRKVQKVVDLRNDWHKRNTPKIAPLTMVLIIACVAVAVGSSLGKSINFLSPLFIAKATPIAEGARFVKGLLGIKSGEVWRLITPIFIHFGLIHLLFNMMWLKDLGSRIETKTSTGFLLMLVLLIAISSNLSEYFYSGPYFGGMSGVVFGLLGFCWVRGRIDPGSGLAIEKNTVVLMTVWYFLCVMGVVGHVANAVHTIGLGMGLAVGYLTGKIRTGWR